MVNDLIITTKSNIKKYKLYNLNDVYKTKHKIVKFSPYLSKWMGDTHSNTIFVIWNMRKKIKLDFQVNQNIYYRAGIFFILIALFINLLTRFEIIPLDWKQLRLFPISIGIPFYFYGIYAHYKNTKDLSFLKQTFLGLLIGFTILGVVYITK